jgi:hypothetical protein
MTFSLKKPQNRDYRAAFGVCKAKNRLTGDFYGFYAQSTTKAQQTPKRFHYR